MLITFGELQRKYGIKPKTVLHLGGSHAEERDAYRDGGVESVLWVEAIPAIYEKLCANIEGYTGHSAINACIHETQGLELDFNVSSNDGQSSSIFELGTHKEMHPDVLYIDKIKVKTMRADSILDTAPDFVNLDLQGAELLALKSMSWLKDVKYIYCEVNEAALYVGCPLVGEIDEYLHEFGFAGLETRLTSAGWGDKFYQNTNIQ